MARKVVIHLAEKKNDQTVLRYVEPAKQIWDGTTTKDTLVVTNFAEWKGLKQSGIKLVMVSFLRFNFGYVQPLIIQAILGFKTSFTTKKARTHLLP